MVCEWVPRSLEMGIAELKLQVVVSYPMGGAGT